MSQNSSPDYLTTNEAAQRLRRSPRTLARMRAEGRGPHYHFEGRRLLYSVDALNDWLAQHVIVPPRSQA